MPSQCVRVLTLLRRGNEAGIAASLVAVGLLIATSAHLPLVASMSMVGLFAIFHGHAHGTKIPVAASPALYALGFVTATGALHLVGIALGYFARGWNARLVRVGGSLSSRPAPGCSAASRLARRPGAWQYGDVGLDRVSFVLEIANVVLDRPTPAWNAVRKVANRHANAFVMIE
jgi:urease accessory protein